MFDEYIEEKGPEPTSIWFELDAIGLQTVLDVLYDFSGRHCHYIHGVAVNRLIRVLTEPIGRSRIIQIDVCGIANALDRILPVPVCFLISRHVYVSI